MIQAAPPQVSIALTAQPLETALDSLHERGFLPLPLLRSSLSIVARLSQINSNDSVTDREREERITRLEREFDRGLLSGRMMQGPHGSVVACGCFERQFNPGGWLDLLMHDVNVHPNQQNQGVGKAIVHLLLADAIEQGVRQIELHVDNPIAMRIYRSAGFYDTGAKSPVRSAIVMRREFENPRKIVPENDPLRVDLSKAKFLDRSNWDAAY